MNMRRYLTFAGLVVLILLCSGPLGWADDDVRRKVISLDGPWQFQVDGAPAGDWRPVALPASFQSHEGTNFHGVGWYRKQVAGGTVPGQTGQRVLLHFQAAATAAEVWWNDQSVGKHLGGWTPFRCDVTDWLWSGPGGPAHEIKVRLDERVGHNTQGFLPAIAPHFGGIWQNVHLLVVPATYIDDLRLLAVGNPGTGRLELEFSLAGTPVADPRTVTVRYRLRGTRAWNSATAPVTPVIETNRVATAIGHVLRVEVPVADFQLWSPTAPNLYEVELQTPATAGGDTVSTRAAFRSVEVRGAELLLNGKQLNVRGVLNWGYAPPRLDPNPGEGAFRRELELARSYGFNLMKFCLWIPPPRYLEMADEAGFLVWEEYPTWHPDMTGKYLAELRQEYDEFFAGDRNHPAVILRSLTCETGSRAEPAVLQALYEQAHARVPRSLVEDDSSWIQWTRFTDFWDDHPYGNNHTWVSTLHSLTDYARQHGSKPLVLGEAITADTWVDAAHFRHQLRGERPFWAPAILDSQPQWLDRMKALAGPEGLAELGPDSLHYAWLMRKYQLETYRREVPSGGYVVSVIRDFPKASMGLLDYSSRPKWSPAVWSWHGATMLLLQTEQDRRSYSSGESLNAGVLVSHFGETPLEHARLTLTVTNPEDHGSVLLRSEQFLPGQNPGTLSRVAGLNLVLPEVTKPARLEVSAMLTSAQGSRANTWSLWLVPQATQGSTQVWVDASVDRETAAELFPGAAAWSPSQTNGIVVAARLGSEMSAFLGQGGRVLLLPDDGTNNFTLKDHWFLRGAPYLPASPLLLRMPRDLLVELQAFDLAAKVLPDVPYLDSIDPMLMLWDTHDDVVVKTHALVFAARAGYGRLLVSALRHRGTENAAGKWLLGQLIEILAGEPAPRHALPPEFWQLELVRER